MKHQNNCIVLGVCLTFSLVIAGSDDWVFDTSERAEELTCSRSASLSSAFESRSVSAFGSNEDAVDSRCGYCQASAGGGVSRSSKT